MIEDIKIMIELQACWNRLLSCQTEIERGRKSVSFWKNELAASAARKSKIETEIRTLKQLIKTGELELADTETRLKKLEERRNSLKTEKELKALGHELGELSAAKDTLEETLLAQMEELQGREEESLDAVKEYSEREVQVTADVAKLEESIRQLETRAVAIEKEFDEGSLALSAAVKGRFQKMIRSKDGKAISEVENEICGGCHFKVPPSLAMETSKNDKIVVCTNCGRFIYSR